MAANKIPNRKAAVWLLRWGWLSVGEIAQALGETRQQVHYWAEASGIDYKRARQQFVDSCRKRAIHATNRRKA